MSEFFSEDKTYTELWIRELNEYAPHSKILQKWEPVAYLDKGTFSRIFKVVHRETGRLGALKFVPNPIDIADCRELGSPEERFYHGRFEGSKREAEIMNRFNGESNIVQYLEEPEFLSKTFEGEMGETLVQYAVFICMPLYASHKEWLSQIIGDRQRKIRLGMDIARALTVFEEKGVYHRDIKPGNVLMDAAGNFCLGDVGEAKLESEFTTVGFHGTRPYMAPEVYGQEKKRSKMRSDHRSDIYSLGIILYKLFNHDHFPFLTEEGTLTEKATESFRTYEQKNQVVGSDYLSDGERARMLRYDGQALPPPAQADAQLARVILRACAYERKERYQNANDLYKALRACLDGQPISEKSKKPASRNALKTALAACCALLVVMMAAIGFLLGKSGTSGHEPATVQEPATATPTPAPTATPEPAGTRMHLANGLIAEQSKRGTWTITGAEGAGEAVVVPSEVQGGAVTAIADSAFYGMEELRSVMIPRGVVSIGENAFADCENLEKISLPEGLETIGSAAFRSCESLNGIVLPQSLTTLGGQAFYGCYALEQIVVPKGIQAIEAGTFNGCTVLSKVALPSGVRLIDEYAFFGCESLKEINLPSGLTVLGENAFGFCISLPEAQLPNGLVSVGTEAFCDCEMLRTAVVPGTVEYMGEYVFKGCPEISLVVEAGSAAERYAKENGIMYSLVQLTSQRQETPAACSLEQGPMGIRVTIPQDAFNDANCVEIYRRDSSGEEVRVARLETRQSFYLDQLLTPEETYTYFYRSLSNYGQARPDSAEAGIQWTSVPHISNLTITADETNGRIMYVSRNDLYDAAYEVGIRREGQEEFEFFSMVGSQRFTLNDTIPDRTTKYP